MPHRKKRTNTVPPTAPPSTAAPIVPPPSEYISGETTKLAKRALELQRTDIEPSSERTYRYLRRHYETFCDLRNLDPFDPVSVSLYVAERENATEPPNTLRSRISAIRRTVLEANLRRPPDDLVLDPTNDPRVREIIKNALKELRKRRKTRRVNPAIYDLLGPLVDATDAPEIKSSYLRESMRLRDRALVLFGFALGRRGAELAAIDVEHIKAFAEGWQVEIPSSKTNKSGESEFVGVPRFPNDPLCPIGAVEKWLTFMGIKSGPIFLTISAFAGQGGRRMRREDISRRLQSIAARAGLPGFWRSHSLRRGVVTSAEQAGVARSRTNMLTGWKSDAMYAIYAEHRDQIGQSPLHEIYAQPLREL
jgi:integrase